MHGEKDGQWISDIRSPRWLYIYVSVCVCASVRIYDDRNIMKNELKKITGISFTKYLGWVFLISALTNFQYSRKLLSWCFQELTLVTLTQLPYDWLYLFIKKFKLFDKKKLIIFFYQNEYFFSFHFYISFANIERFITVYFYKDLILLVNQWKKKYRENLWL